MLPGRLEGDAEVDARLLAPEKVGGNGNETLFGRLIASLADIGAHPEHLVPNDNSGPRDIGVKPAVPAVYQEAILRYVLPR